jgi:hypothetical protein
MTARPMKLGTIDRRHGMVDAPDADHPIRWESADGRETAWLSVDDAAARLARWYSVPVAQIAEALREGTTLRTDFAFYHLEAAR